MVSEKVVTAKSRSWASDACGSKRRIPTSRVIAGWPVPPRWLLGSWRRGGGDCRTTLVPGVDLGEVGSEVLDFAHNFGGHQIAALVDMPGGGCCVFDFAPIPGVGVVGQRELDGIEKLL